jgi:hypothetical protein
MNDPKLIKSQEDLQSYIDWIRSLRPSSGDSPEFKILKDFKYFSPEKIALKVGANKIQTSRWINKVKSEIWRRVNRIEIVEKMNKNIPKVGQEISYWQPWSYHKADNPQLLYSSNCICIRDYKSDNHCNFFGGVVYKYVKLEEGNYIVVWRSKSMGDLEYNKLLKPEEFNNHFKDYRDWKIESLF